MTELDRQDISTAAAAIRKGGLVAMPTETVYGLAADATNDRAVARIYEVKSRPQFNPLIAHVSGLVMAEEYGVFSPLARKLSDTFWPGPLTIVVPRLSTCKISLLASAGLDTIGLRMPDHPLAQALISTVDRPLAAPSANPSGAISPTTAAHVRAGLGDKIDHLLDGGPARVGVESTIVKVIDDQITLLRPGGITHEALVACCGQPIPSPDVDTEKIGTKVEAPGMLTSHYAPNAPVHLNANDPQQDEAFLGFGPLQNHPHTMTLSAAGDLIEAAANLFAMMHQLDDLCTKHTLKAIAVAPIPNKGLGVAINDRLRRAAT